MNASPPSQVTLVIPGRNAVRTLRKCLGAARGLLESGELAEIVFVDDGSTDETRTVAEEFPVRCLAAGGGGPGHARNVGWRAAETDLVWFIDSDCVPEPDALARLLGALEDPEAGGVGGSYGNIEDDSLLAKMIHEEIRERHLRVRDEVDYLGSFNVLYRREALEQAGGFDETWVNGPGAPGGEDADLSYRVADLGWRLRFEPRSLVHHFHPTRLGPYLRAQRLHGFWGVRLYARHMGRSAGNSYSGFLDHLQPPLAMLALASLPSLAAPALRWLSPALAALLALAHVPMAARLAFRTRDPGMLAFIALGPVRALARGLGMTKGVLGLYFKGLGPPSR